MKEEIERRRAEAAEKRQKVEDNTDGEDRPFKCVSPRGSSLKVRTKFVLLFLSPPPTLTMSQRRYHFTSKVCTRYKSCFIITTGASLWTVNCCSI